MSRGVRNVQTTEATSVTLPLVTDMERAIASTEAFVTSGRFMLGDITLQFTIAGTLEEIQAKIAYLETKGWRCTLASDAEARERKDTNRDTFEQEEQGNTPRRNGQRDYQPKEERLVVPFGKYKGTPLSVVETRDPSYVDWLAKNAEFDDVKKAAQKLVNTRDEHAPF